MKNCHIALLRGINVGGNNKLRMVEFAGLLEELGLTGVKTYIQSGNAVFGASEEQARGLSNNIKAALQERFGLSIPVVVRSAEAFRSAVEDNPFLEAGVDLGSLHMGFMMSEPTASQLSKLNPEESSGDEFRVLGDTIYLHCPDGLAKTKLSNAYFDKVLQTVSTFRNWKTVTKLGEMIDEFEG